MIQTFLAGLDASTFLASELHKAAILQKLTVIGEAAARLPQVFREATHRWATSNDDVPVLRRQIMAILQAENLEQPQQGACA